MWRYTGDGFEHFPGVPARDLTDAEAAALHACEVPGQVLLQRPDGSEYPFNVVPVRGSKPIVGDDGETTVLEFDLSTLGIYEYVPDEKPGKKPAGETAGAGGAA